jgi:hypothetical protein
MKRPLLNLLMVCAATIVNATPPPQLPANVLAGKPALKTPPTRGATLGTLRVKFERTTLSEVAHAAGSGRVLHQGDAGESVYWLCYRSPGPDYVDLIWLLASGEMGGAEHSITEIIATRGSNSSAASASDCPQLPSTLVPVSFDGQLWLGVATHAVESTLGAPSHRDGAWRSFQYEGKVPGNCAGGFDTVSWLATYAQSARIQLIAAGQTTSC